MGSVPVLRFDPLLEIVKADVGKFALQRGTINGETDTVKPLIHFYSVVAHALANDFERDLKIGDGPGDDLRKNSHGFVTGEFIASKIEALAGETIRVFKDADSDCADVG